MKTKALKMVLFTALILSCSGRQAEIKNDPELNSRLYEAVYTKDHKMVKKYLKKGADPDTLMDDGKSTVLHLAIYKHDFETFRLLSEAGADISRSSEERFVPLTLAARNNDKVMTQYLIDKGCDVNHINDDRFNSTALMEAANNNAVDAMQILIDNGADLDIVDNVGYSALGFAAGKGQYEALVLLAEAGADIHIIGNYNDMNALDFALMRDDRKMIEYLESRGAVPNAYGYEN